MSKDKPRDKGEGSVYPLKDGRWRGSIEIGLTAGGLRRRKTVTRKTEKEVKAALRRLQQLHEQGGNLMPERQTVAQFCERWLQDVARLKVRPITLANYQNQLRWYVLPYIGQISLQKLTAQHVQGLIGQLDSAGLAPSTIQLVRVTLSQALKQAVAWDLIPRNVAAGATTPRLGKSRAQALTPAQARQLLAAVKGDRLEALYTTALMLGLRRGEILGLRWADLNFTALTLRVAQSLTLVRDQLSFGEPKTAASRRTIPMPELVSEALAQHHTRQQHEQALAGPRWVPHDLVFATPLGEPLNPQTVRQGFQAILARAGLPRVRFHDLRTTCATLLALKNVPPRVAQEILGHADISTTLETYTQVFDESRKAAAMVMDDLFGGDL